MENSSVSAVSLAKLCSKCSFEKPLEAGFFSRDAKSRDGFNRVCKACVSLRERSRYERNPGPAIEKSRRRYRQKRDELLAEMRTKYADDPDKVRKRVRARKEAKRDEINARSRELYAADRDRRRAKVNEASKRRQRENPEAVRAYRRAWLSANPHQKLSHNIGTAIGASLAGNKAGRRWEQLVGYTLAELRVHLERQFRQGMTWDNYGRWHVDHIRPIASFRFTDAESEEFRACWALSNLQPLWASENLSKKATVLVLL